MRIASIILGTFSLSVSLIAGDITGTWNLNIQKSTLHNPLQSYLMKIELTPPNKYLCVFDVVNAKGQKRHVEIVRISDGKEHPVEGVNVPPGATEIVSPGLTKVIRKTNGKVTGEVDVEFAADGKIHRVTQTGIDESGKPYKDLLVFEKQ
jgi:hypothetical protein